MSLTPEWRKRIDHWQKTIQTLIYRPLGPIEFSGFTTPGSLTPPEALQQKFVRWPEGKRWGAKWEYGWFKARVKLPAEARGARIVFTAAPGGECLVYVNGRAVGALDRQHREIVLDKSARAGAVYDILLEAYAGHGQTPCGGGPCPDGVLTVPEPPAQQQTMGPASFGVWVEELFQLYMDAEVLFQLRDSLDPNSLRVAEIDAALRDYTVLCDLEAPHAELLAGARAARKRLKPLLAARNGSTVPELYCFGHAHLDTAWLWPLQETSRKACRTLANQLALAEAYPGYRFLHSQAHLYTFVRDRAPELYRRVREAVRKGRVVAEGGMWVEADTNITGGESLIRQFLHGKRFFREEFGVESEMLWLPDVFGYSGAMPQIMRGCGVKYFATSKIFWTYNGGDPFPYHTFFWEGIDGSRVLSHLYRDYNSQTWPRQLTERWNNRVQKDGIHSFMIPFGWGDGGGGPTRLHLECLARERDLEGMPRTRHAHPLQFFRDQETDTAGLPSYVGELYFQAHRGTYTSQARTKKGNRKCEINLREAEFWGALAARLAGYRYPVAALRDCWTQVLLNQFHDIIPGSSIQRVYEEAEAGYARVLAETHEMIGAAAGKLVRANRDAVTVFNSLSWGRPALVPLPPHFEGASSSDGTPLPVQKIGGVLHAQVTEVPSCGWRTVTRAPAAKRAGSGLKVTADTLENEYLRVQFNARGEIRSLYEKTGRRELAAAPCNALRMFKDVPVAFDAWDIDSTYKAGPVPLDEDATITVLDRGPLVVGLKIVRRLHNSTLTQTVRLRAGSRRLDFATTIDWHEKHKLLKVCFPVNVRADTALHEIQFGHLERPTHQSRPFDVDRFEVSAHKWTALCEENHGCAVLNDCKYGVSVDENSINLTLLKSALAPDMHADQGRQEFTYSFVAWEGPFADSGVVREGYDLNMPVTVTQGAAGERSLLALDESSVLLETLKLAEDGSGDLILRLYEAERKSVRCSLTLDLPVRSVRQVNMIEEEAGKPLPLRNNRVRLAFRPFEIKTLRVKIRAT